MHTITITYHGSYQQVFKDGRKIGNITYCMDDATWWFEHRSPVGPHMDARSRDGLLVKIAAYVFDRKVD